MSTAATRPPSVATWTLPVPDVPASVVLRLQRYRDPARAPRAIQEAAEGAVREGTALMTPCAAVWRGPARTVNGGRAVVLGERERFESRLLARVLDGCAQAYVVIVTIGTALETRVTEHFAAQRALEGLFLDTAGMAGVIRAAASLRRSLRDATRPARVTHRVAPGYGDWPVDDQATLLALFGDGPLPVTLTDACWMLPRKSLSGVIGIEAAV